MTQSALSRLSGRHFRAAADELMELQLALHGGEFDKYRPAICVGVQVLNAVARHLPVDAAKEQYRSTNWSEMPLCARKAYLRMVKAIPTAPSDGWDYVQPYQERRKRIWAVNSLGDWYVADTDGDYWAG